MYVSLYHMPSVYAKHLRQKEEEEKSSYLFNFCDWFDLEIIFRPITPASCAPSECPTTWNLSISRPFLNALSTWVDKTLPSWGRKKILHHMKFNEIVSQLNIFILKINACAHLRYRNRIWHRIYKIVTGSSITPIDNDQIVVFTCMIRIYN